MLSLLALFLAGTVDSLFQDSESFLSSNTLNGFPPVLSTQLANEGSVHARLLSNSPTSSTTPIEDRLYHYDVVIVGLGVGGHGAALHSASQGLKVAVVSAPGDVGGTCVNRGCVPSKALLAAADKVYNIRNDDKLRQFGISIRGDVTVDREGVARHASGLVSNIRSALESSMKRHGVQIITGIGTIIAPHQVRVKGVQETIITARDIILAPGSTPSVPPSIQPDGINVITSDHAVTLPSIPQWVLIVGGGYIGLEFAEIYSSLGSDVTIVESMDRILPTFDKDIAAMAEKLILNARKIELKTSVVVHSIDAGEIGKRPTMVHLHDARTGQRVQSYGVDLVMIATGRKSAATTLNLENIGITLKPGNIVPVDEHMRVLNTGGIVVPNLYCIGDANGKLMLAHAASAQGISVVEEIMGRPNVVNHNIIPAAAFTHPQIASVGLSEEAATKKAADNNFVLGTVSAHFRANTKALAENENGGFAKLLYRKDTGHVVGAQMIGLHASDLIQQIANVMASGSTVHTMARAVHIHPTLSEVVLDLYRQAAGMLAH